MREFVVERRWKCCRWYLHPEGIGVSAREVWADDMRHGLRMKREDALDWAEFLTGRRQWWPWVYAVRRVHCEFAELQGCDLLR